LPVHPGILLEISPSESEEGDIEVLLAFLAVKCLLNGGHDDVIRREGDRIRLECCECHRKTVGWHIGIAKHDPSADE
jgi:hypothetical protein